jgi:hypothetical protein
MKNGILRDDEGYDLLVHGADRTFSDTKDGAYEVARELKVHGPDCPSPHSWRGGSMTPALPQTPDETATSQNLQEQALVSPHARQGFLVHRLGDGRSPSSVAALFWAFPP